MKNRLRDWSNVRYFLAVCRAGSTLAAAKELGSAQPTVARRIDALEHELGLVLFDRGPRGFRPTGAARSLMAAAEAIEAAAEVFAGKATDFTSRRVITMTAPAGNFTARVHKIIHDFAGHHPGIDLKFLPTNDFLDLMAGEADIALRMSHLAPDKRLIRRKISTPRYALYGSPGYADRHGLPASERDMQGHRYVTYRPKGEAREAEHWILRHASASRIVRSYVEYDLMHEAIMEGEGLGIMNVRSCEGNANLVQCFDPIGELDQEYLMLVAPASYRRPEVRQFVKFFAPRYVAFFR
jgi:DNA-binding transcriptional LysR family regulator